MWLDVVALILLGVCIGMGCLRGALASFVGLAALVAGYAASVAAAPATAARLRLWPELPAVARVALAGCAVFLLVYLAIAIAGKLALRAQRERTGGTHSLRDRFLGGAFGAVRGAFLVLMVSWLALWLDAVHAAGHAPAQSQVAGSAAGRVTSAVVEASLGAALGGGPEGPFVARLAARPALAVGELQRVLENPRFEALRGDALFWTYVEAGSIDTAVGRVSFRDLARDAELRQELVALGVVTPEAGRDEAAFTAAVAAVLREAGPRLRALREDPALQRLVEDPEVAAMLRSGDYVALLSHPGFRQLVARTASGAP